MNPVISSDNWQFLISIIMGILPMLSTISNKKPRFTKTVMLTWIILYLSFEIVNPLFNDTVNDPSYILYFTLFRIGSVINLFGYIVLNWHFRKAIYIFFSDLNKNCFSEINIKKEKRNLNEKQIQQTLSSFSKDATKLYSFSGRAYFLNETHDSFDKSQFELIKSLGNNCKILVSTYSKELDKLIDHDVQIRLYPSTRLNDNLRGSIKLCQLNGSNACLFSKYLSENDVKYEYIEITNGEVVKVLQNDFNNMFRTKKNPSLKHVIFDLAGVAFEGDIQDFYKKVFEITNRKINNKASNHGCINQDLNLGKINICDYVASKIRKKLTLKEKEDIIEAWTSTWKLNPYIKQYIEELKSLGYFVSIASNCDEENMNNYDLKGWFSIFDQHFLSNEMGVVKPDNEFYKIMLDKLNVNPSECLFIDDYKFNIEAAKKLGFNTVQIDRMNNPLKKINNIREKINEH